MTNNAKFIDSLLDQWDFATPEYFTKATATAVIDNTTMTDIQNKINNLYLVFHYPQYTDGNNLNSTEFTSGDTKPNPIIPSDRIFNYIDGTNKDSKKLLSSKGISKDNMVTLKVILSELAAAAADAAKAYTILTTNQPASTITGTTLGGNNTMITKTSGGRNKNKSNKKMKKLRKRNKSSKCLI